MILLIAFIFGYNLVINLNLLNTIMAMAIIIYEKVKGF